MKIGIIYLIVCILCISSCSKDEVDSPQNHDQNKISADLADFGEANYAFAFDLLHETINRVEAGKNTIISPLSVHIALQMAMNGADEETYTAISTVLHSEEYAETTINKAYAELIDYLITADGKTAINVANSIFWDKSKMTPHLAFKETMQEHYNAHLEELDFLSPDALTTINDWVNTQTEGRIEKILDKINPEEVMFLINALYFSGDWEVPFPEEGTFDSDFKLSDGSSTPVPMMNHDNLFQFYMGNDLQAVDLVFGDSAYSMTFIRPVNDDTSIDAFIQNLDGDRLKNLWENDLQRSRLFLKLPKFEVEYDINLNDVLKGLGMEIAFDRNKANFSRLGASSGNLFIGRVKHKIFLKIDETGAEGAAVTAVGIGVTSAPPTLFFDRSFLIVLRDIKHNSILFTGKIENPVEE